MILHASWPTLAPPWPDITSPSPPLPACPPLATCLPCLQSGTYALNAGRGKKERIGRLMEMHANSREDVKEARAGDIIAIAGLKDVVTGDTLCDEKAPVLLERMDFPDPVIKVRAVERGCLMVAWRCWRCEHGPGAAC